MKNKFKYVPLTLSAFLIASFGISNASAKTFDATEIDKISGTIYEGEMVYENVYIIGNHLFTGYITLDDIMTASRTIEDGKPNMIYYRSTDKTWSDALKDSPITAPETFEIKVANKESVEDAVLAARLLELKAQVEEYKEDEYTTDSWKNISDALALEESTDDLKQVKVSALETSFTNLRFKNLDTLEALVTEVEGYVKEDYTETSYNGFLNSYNDIKDMETDTFVKIEAKITMIKSLQKVLVLNAVDASSLTTLIDGEYSDSRTTLKLNVDHYTTVSWDAYLTALEKAKEAESASLQSVIEKAKQTLTDAKKALVFANLEELTSLKEVTYDETLYTENSFKALTDALALTETNFDEIKTKITAIKKADAELITLVSEEALKVAKEAATKYIKVDYDTESYGKLEAALAKEETTDKEYQDKVTAINEAISGLKFAGLKALEDEMKLHEALVETDYTKETWNVYVAIKESVIDRELKSNSDVIAVTTALESAREVLVKVSNNMSELTTAIDNEYSDTTSRTTLNLTQSEYTVATWSAYEKALADAKTIESKNDALASEVANAKKAILDTKAALVFANLEELNTLIETKKALVASEYTEASFKALTDALVLTEEDSSTFAKIEAKIDAIEAISLVFANQKTVDDLEVETNKLDSALYTTESFAKVTEALAKEETTYALIQEKITAINNSVANLIKKATVEALTQAIDSLTDKDETHYTAESFEIYQTAIDLEYTNETELLAKIEQVKTAIKSLVFANLEQLNTLIEAKKALVASEYTEESFKDLTDALVLTEEDSSTFAKIEAKIDAIKAINLVFANQKTVDDLEVLVNKLTRSEYTEESYKALEEALKLEETTYALIETKMASINTAKDNLVFINQDTLNKLKESMDLLNKDEYSEVSYKVLEDALNLEETTYALIETKIASINTAKTALEFKNVSELKSLLANSGLTQSEYTTESFANLNKVISENQLVKEDTFESINTKINNIKEARKNLVIVNLEQLTALKEELSKLVSSDYEEASYLAYQQAYDLVKGYKESTYALINIKIDALKAAKEKLVAKELVLTNLQTIIDTQYNEGELIITNADGKYTAASYLAYTEALKKAEEVLASYDSLLQSKIDEVVTTLENAKTDLTLVEEGA